MHHRLRNHFGRTRWYSDQEAQVEARFGLFGDRAILIQDRMHGLHGMYHMLRNHFGRTRLNS